MAKRNEQLVEWEATYPLEALSMSTPEGILWENRGQASEAYFNDYSWDWEDNLALLTDVRKLALAYGDYIMIAYPIVQNFVSDTYYRNPDPLIQDKSGNRDLSRMLTDLASSVHNDVNSEQKMQHAFQDQSWSGFGMVFTTMRQKVYEIDGELMPEWQRIIVKTISPWKVRFDPRGREWDMSDHAYVTFYIQPKLGQLMRWGWITDEDRRRIIAWNRMGMRDAGSLDMFESQRIDFPLMADGEETDPDLIEIPIWMNWDRTKKMVVYRPVGSRFTLTPQPWPEEFAAADCFPCVYMAKNREPENKRGTNGFIGIPDLRLIKPHLLAIRRLESLFLAANQHVIFKYLTPKGAFSTEQQDKLYSDKQRQVIEWDATTLDAFPNEVRTDPKFIKELLMLVPQPELKETRHLVGIQHEFDMIAQIMGQSSGDRGGMPQTETATDSMIINQRLNQRLSTLRHEAGKHYRTLTKLFFMILKQRQVLPIPYQMTTMYNEKVWMQFSADNLRDIDLHFDYAVGSGEPRTREKEFELRQQMAAILMPILQARGDVRGMMKVARDLVEMLNIRDADQFFNDEAIEIAKQLAGLVYAIQKGDVNAADPRATKALMDGLGALLDALLTEQDLAAALAGRAGKSVPEPESAGSSPKALSAGEASYEAGAMGSAAAGAVGGMA